MQLLNNHVRLLSDVKNGEKGAFAVFRSDDCQQRLMLRHRFQCYDIVAFRLYISINGKSRVYIEDDFQEVLLCSLRDGKKHDIEAHADIITPEGLPVFNDSSSVKFMALILAEVPNQAVPFTLFVDYTKHGDADPVVHIGRTTERSVVDLWIYQAQFSWYGPDEFQEILPTPQIDTKEEMFADDVPANNRNCSIY